MKRIWKLYYKRGKKSTQFAEIISSKKSTTIRKGDIFTVGALKNVKSFKNTEKELIKSGYKLEREWVLDFKNRDYDLFISEIKKSIEMDPNFSKSNALAIITDSCLGTISYSLEYFKNIKSVPDEKLWDVEEWGGGFSDYWQLDIPYRWLLAYEYFDKYNNDKHFKEVIKCFKNILKSYKANFDILLIDVGGDNCGHRWSASCMEKKLSKRMLKWI